MTDPESVSSGSEAESISSEVLSETRPSRHKTLPMRLQNAHVQIDELQNDPNRSVVVQCSQTGKQHTCKVKDLSREDSGTLTDSDMVPGADVMMTYKGKPYPAKFLHFKESKSKSSVKRGKASGKKGTGGNSSTTTAGGKRDNNNSFDSAVVAEALEKAKNDTNKPSSSKKPKLDTHTFLDSEDKDLLINLTQKVEGIEKKLEKLISVIEDGSKNIVKTESSTDQDIMVNGIHIMRIPSRDAYSYALHLMDVFFTKDELSQSLVFKSKKSVKPPLDHKKVEKILGYVEKRYGDKWDMKTLTLKMNQKCRDSKASTSAQASSDEN